METEPVPVDELMSTDLVTISVDATVASAASRMLDAGVGSILVVDDGGRLEGLLTGRDFVRLVRENEPHEDTLVGDYMTTDLVTVSPADPLDELTDLTDGTYSHLPVTEADGTVVGMLSTTDLTGAVAR
jgi:CBS domain-containing protein